MIKISKNKYLRKNEFKYDMSEEVRRPDGRGHVVYVTARKGHKYKTNVITHSKSFFDNPTMKLINNPHKESTYKIESRVSIPVWRNERYLSNTDNGSWNMSKKDRLKIKKMNQRYEGYGKYKNKKRV